MFKTKILAGILLIAVMLISQTGTALAAPALQDGSVTGKVTALECGTDANGALGDDPTSSAMVRA